MSATGHQIPRFLDDDLTKYHRVMEINLYGPLLGTRFAGRYMAEHESGVIINSMNQAAETSARFSRRNSQVPGCSR
jgi:NAD(P)-dependent dehydrogenase (short-subunit alcohol dehydrogenase family)